MTASRQDLSNPPLVLCFLPLHNPLLMPLTNSRKGRGRCHAPSHSVCFTSTLPPLSLFLTHHNPRLLFFFLLRVEIDEVAFDVASTHSSQKIPGPVQRTESEATLKRLRKEKKLVPLQSFVEHLWQPSDTKAGVGIMAFKKKYNFARHLVFALLKGRPVIIHGQNEKYSLPPPYPPSDMIIIIIPCHREVRLLVVTLSLFVPGNPNKKKIVPWRTKAISLADLSDIKLAGLPKTYTIQKNVERYVSIMDFEAETLKSPPYANGLYVEQIMSRQKNWVVSSHSFVENNITTTEK